MEVPSRNYGLPASSQIASGITYCTVEVEEIAMFIHFLYRKPAKNGGFATKKRTVAM